MDRRKFLKHSTAVFGASVLMPSMVVSCVSETQENNPKNVKVLIIGAGAAGLFAGYTLKKKGVSFEILEASSKYGGRLGKQSGFADFDIDQGAEWLHLEDSIIGKIIKETQTKITLDDTELKYWYNNEITSTLPLQTDIFRSETEVFQDVSYWEHAHQKGLDNSYNNIIEAYAGDQGASATNISVKWDNEEAKKSNSQEKNYKFEKTYFDVFENNIIPFVKQDIKLNTIVKKIDYSGNSIEVTDLNGTVFIADKVIVTVPITILKSNDIIFKPSLPNEKTMAFQKIGMEAGMKVFLKFSEKFYPSNFVYGGSVCAAYGDVTLGKQTKDNILLAFVMGKQAQTLSDLNSHEAITSALLTELDYMFNGRASASFVKSTVQDFTKHPFIKGAYSYSSVGMGNAREILAQSVGDKIFFAGEATNLQGDHQTVHGAVATGVEQAEKIVSLLK
ncbi:flavin monoamine oxidase family protein [Flavobacterium columnare]|uniref:flavin monoamine oxidase family protein n=1 Tax=Flavobacterium columnare TaxID=996 RepID=UPI0018964BA9|nr:FAD-dependent oxidoreductase [Flavobacterium columnare]MBF6655082.1 hypothetical protein [Flavobacterium columnare]MBF6657792.1 hypothetical protein [Flavobacterium columnare]